MSNKKGNQHFFAKIVENNNKYTTLVTEGESSINSKNGNYYKDPSVQVKKTDIDNAQCGRNCLVIISVFST